MIRLLRKIFSRRRRVFVNFERRKLPKGYICNAVTIEEKDWIKIVPVGYFPEHPDGAHEITAANIDEMVANFKLSKTAVLVDVDHASLWGNTRAAGWSEEVEAREDGLYMKKPDWVGDMGDLIANKAYRYFSPVYCLADKDKRGRQIGAVLDSVAVTNRPYFDNEIDPIRNSRSQEDVEMKFTDEQLVELRKNYKLAEDATEEEVQAAIIANSKPAADPPKEPPAEPNSPASDVDPIANSPVIKQISETLNTLVANSQKTHAQTIKDEVQTAIDAGKILERDREIWVNSLTHDYENTKKKLAELKANSAMPSKLQVDDKDNKPLSASETRATIFKNAGAFLDNCIANTRRMREGVPA